MKSMASAPNIHKGRALFKKLGSPRTVLAPMVDASELAWRIFCRKHGAQMCYSPMYHARLFGTTESYRESQFGTEDYTKTDTPLVVQFCSNKPNELVDAVNLVKGRCDAVDLNLGCPQGIARKGHYGAFLMDEWDLVASLINAVSTEVPDVPITAKIRIFEDKQKTLAYARKLLEAGAYWLTVHGRTREMKGQQTGLADWTQIEFLRKELPEELVLIANGNIIYKRNIEECLAKTGADAVMIAETALAYPGIFSPQVGEKVSIDDFPRVDLALREYFEIAKSTAGSASTTSMKTHMFKLLRTFFVKETDIRNQLGPIKSGEFEKFEDIVSQVETRVAELLKDEKNVDEIGINGEYVTVPHWRTQPLFRIVNGVASNGVQSQVKRVKRTAEEITSGDSTDSKRAKAETSSAPSNTSSSANEQNL